MDTMNTHRIDETSAFNEVRAGRHVWRLMPALNAGAMNKVTDGRRQPSERREDSEGLSRLCPSHQKEIQDKLPS